MASFLCKKLSSGPFIRLSTVAVSNHLGFVITSQPANFTLLAGGSTTLIVGAAMHVPPSRACHFLSHPDTPRI